MPEDTPTPPSKPHRQVLMVFDLTDHRHRAILGTVARHLRLGGQAEKAAAVYAMLDASAAVVEVTEPEVLPDYFDGADPAAAWPVLYPTETHGMQANTEGQFWPAFDRIPLRDLITEADLADLEGGPDAA